MFSCCMVVYLTYMFSECLCPLTSDCMIVVELSYAKLLTAVKIMRCCGLEDLKDLELNMNNVFSLVIFFGQ